MSTTEPTPTPEMSPTGRMLGLEAQIITQAIQNPAFREKLAVDPKSVLIEQGLDIPDDVQINVLSESSTQYYLVLPMLAAPAVTETAELSDTELEAVAGGATSSDQRQWTGCASGVSGCIVTGPCASRQTAGPGAMF